MVAGCFPGVVSAQPSYCPRWYRRADRDAWPKESVAIRVRKRRALSDTRNGRPLEKATYEASSFRPPFRFGVASGFGSWPDKPTPGATTSRSHISGRSVTPLWRNASANRHGESRGRLNCGETTTGRGCVLRFSNRWRFFKFFRLIPTPSYVASKRDEYARSSASALEGRLNARSFSADK